VFWIYKIQIKILYNPITAHNFKRQFNTAEWEYNGIWLMAFHKGWGGVGDGGCSAFQSPPTFPVS